MQEEEVEPDLSLIFQEIQAPGGGLKITKKAEKKKKGSSGQLPALVLTPTRELAVQVKRHIEAVARNLNIKVRRKRDKLS